MLQEVFTKLRSQLEKRWDLIYMEADAKYKYIFCTYLAPFIKIYVYNVETNIVCFICKNLFYVEI